MCAESNIAHQNTCIAQFCLLYRLGEGGGGGGVFHPLSYNDSCAVMQLMRCVVTTLKSHRQCSHVASDRYMLVVVIWLSGASKE